MRPNFIVSLLILTLPTDSPAQTREQNWISCRSVNPDAVIRACTAIIDAGGESAEDLAEAYLNRARAKRGKGDLKEALADVLRVLETRPTAQAYFYSASLKGSMGDQKGAIADYTISIDLEPNPASLTNRGLARIRAGDVNGGLEDFTRAIDLDPTNDVALANRGQVKAERRDRTALADLDRAIELRPTSGRHYAHRSYARMTFGDYPGALEDAERAIRYEPGFYWPHDLRGSVKLRMGDAAGALADLSRAIELSPTSSAPYASRADARSRIGDFDGAFADIDRAIAVAPTQAGLHVVRATIARRKGDLDVALQAYSRAIELNPLNPGYVHGRGIVRSDRREFAEARADFAEALRLGSTNDYTHLRLFLIDARTGNRARAIETLNDVIARRKAAKFDDWVMRIADFLVGRLPESDLMKAAETGNPLTTRERQCEAYFYIGWVKLVDGDETAARDLFRKAVATGAVTMLELTSAEAELRVTR